MKILDLGHLNAYRILREDVTILLVKVDVLLDISWHLDPILIFDGVPLSLEIKFIEHTDKLLRNLGYIPFPIPLGHVEDIIISFIGVKGEIFLYIDLLHRILSLFPIIIWYFPVSIYLVKCTHIRSILIPIVEYVDEGSLF